MSDAHSLGYIPLEVRELFNLIHESGPNNTNKCTGQDGKCAGREIVLFPFEHIFLQEKTGDCRITSGKVPQGATCPYKNGDSCGLAENKPLACRMAPAEFERVADNKLRILLRKGTKLSDNQISATIDKWLAYLMSLWQYLPKVWWQDHDKGIPKAQYKNLGEVEFELENPLSAADRGVVLTMDQVAKFVDSNCSQCQASGLITDPETQQPTACVCVRKNFWNSITNQGG